MTSRRTLAFALAAPVALSLLVAGGQAGGSPTNSVASGQNVEYTVLIEVGADRQAAVDAVTAAGGTVVRENAAIGALVVDAPTNGFIQLVSASPAVFGAAHAKPIGRIPRTEGGAMPQRDVSEYGASTGAAPAGTQAGALTIAELEPVGAAPKAPWPPPGSDADLDGITIALGESRPRWRRASATSATTAATTHFIRLRGFPSGTSV